MSYLSGASPGTMEQWELVEGRYIDAELSGLSHRRRMAILLSVGLVTAIEISNRLSVNVLLPGPAASSPCTPSASASGSCSHCEFCCRATAVRQPLDWGCAC